MNEKIIVLTMYGTGEAVNHFTITIFGKGDGWGHTTVDDYCSNINELKLKDDDWIYAIKIKENEKIKFEKPLSYDFQILCSLDDHAIQKILREVADIELVKALKSADKNILRVVLRNMSKRSVKWLIENMGSFFFTSSEEETKKAREQICGVIRHLEYTS
jgi:flagellar motor switch protein FliG